MSPTMIFGRILLPMVGVTLAAVLAWQLATARSAPVASSPAASSWDENGEAGRKSLADGANIVAEGRVVPAPGARVVVGAEVSGTIASVAVREKSVVKKGDLLVEFKLDEMLPSIREAAAQLAEAEAMLAHSVQDGVALDSPRAKGVFTANDRDAIRHDIGAARSHRDAAKAAVERLEIAKSKYRVVAPMDGVVVASQVEPGETVQFAAPLVTIVDLSRLRIRAEVDEFDVSRCAAGSTASITAEGYPGKSWGGIVEEVADSVVGRDIRPEDPARVSDAGILPVRIKIREPFPLKLGQRVEVRIGASTEQ